MKIKTHQIIRGKLKSKNSTCNDGNKVCLNAKRVAYIILIWFSSFCLTAEAVLAQTGSPKKEEENLNVFQQWIKWNNPGSMSLNHLTRQAEDYYKIRDKQIAKLKTRSDWQKRQREVRNKLTEIIGPFPKKEALNPEITGIVQKGGYRIEKIIYQPVPGYYETGCLYIPDNLNGKAPAILNVFGHD